MKLKAPGRKKKNKDLKNEPAEEVAAALAGELPAASPEPAPAEEPTPTTEEETPVTEEPEPTTEEQKETPVTEDEPEPAPIAEPVEEPVEIVVTEPAQEEEEEAVEEVEEEAVQEVEEEPAEEEPTEDEAVPVSVDLTGIAPVYGVIKKGPYIMPNAPAKVAKTIKKQKWSTQFCRIDPHLYQIFSCDKDKGAKRFSAEAPTQTDGKCMFFHLHTYTTVSEGEDDLLGKQNQEFTFRVSGVNGSEENTVIFSTTTYEEREKWVKCIKRTVNRIIIDQNRVGDHTKLRKLLTEQEAEISILEEELEKMAAVAGECSSRSIHAEGKLAEREADCGSLSLKVDAASREVLSLKQQVAILEERAHNLTMLADDVGTASKEDVQAAKEKMAADRAARLKAIQLEVNGDEDYLGNYKKYLNLKRDHILQKHGGSTFSVNSLGQPKVSPMTAAAPTALN